MLTSIRPDHHHESVRVKYGDELAAAAGNRPAISSMSCLHPSQTGPQQLSGEHHHHHHLHHPHMHPQGHYMSVGPDDGGSGLHEAGIGYDASPYPSSVVIKNDPAQDSVHSADFLLPSGLYYGGGGDMRNTPNTLGNTVSGTTTNNTTTKSSLQCSLLTLRHLLLAKHIKLKLGKYLFTLSLYSCRILI